MAKVNAKERKLWRGRVITWQASNMNGAKWCRKNGIPKNKFYYWKRRLLDSHDQSSEQPSFVELSDESSESGIVLRVQGIEVQLAKEFDSKTLMQTLHCLGTGSC